MVSTTSSQKAAERYRDRLAHLYPRDECDITAWPGYAKLQKFMIDAEQLCTKPPGFSIITIPGEGDPSSELSTTPTGTPWNHLENLPSLADTSPSSHLIVVENICPHTLAVLGGTYDIDPQFFAEHVNIISWYMMYERVPERLPSLPSTKKREDFLVLKYVETREVEFSPQDVDDKDSILWPDKSKTRVRQTAGRMEPISSLGVTYPRMAFTRQTVSVWCRSKTGGKGWIAIMLLDPPFKLPKGHGRIGDTEYRNPNIRPESGEEFHGNKIRQSFGRAFSYLLQQRCSTDSMYLKACVTDPFLVLFEGYRIVASEWLCVNEYVKRQLANIERQLEKPDSTFQELEKQLKELYRIRRRCNKDYELVTEAAQQCITRGQTLWPSSKTAQDRDNDATTVAERHAQELEGDLQYVLDSMNINISRIEKDINLLMGLVAIGEGRQGLLENRGIALLTLIAMIFLPFQTVATILGVQTQYGPGASSFWILWAIALPLTAVVVTIPFFYSTASAALNQLKAKYSPVNPKAQGMLPKELKNELIELYSFPMARRRQASLHSEV